MADTIETIGGTRVLVCDDTGARLATESDANDFLSLAWAQDATLVAIPVQRLSDDFFQLETRLAGAVAQKFVNYQVGLAIVGDISPWTDRSKALRDFIFESNKGTALRFVANLDDLWQRLR